jgi:hypothetical protein
MVRRNTRAWPSFEADMLSGASLSPVHLLSVEALKHLGSERKTSSPSFSAKSSLYTAL